MKKENMRWNEKIVWLFYQLSPCQRVRDGYECRRNNPRYNYHCDVCGRYGKKHDPDIVEK